LWQDFREQSGIFYMLLVQFTWAAADWPGALEGPLKSGKGDVRSEDKRIRSCATALFARELGRSGPNNCPDSRRTAVTDAAVHEIDFAFDDDGRLTRTARINARRP